MAYTKTVLTDRLETEWASLKDKFINSASNRKDYEFMSGRMYEFACVVSLMFGIDTYRDELRELTKLVVSEAYDLKKLPV